MSKVVWIIIGVLIIWGIFSLVSNNSGDITPIGDTVTSIKDDSNVLVANLIAVDGSQSSGTAYVVREGGKLTHLVEASMPDPAPDNSYEGWLVNVSTSPFQFFSTGVMSRNGEGVWTLEYSVDNEYPDHNRVVITEETVVDEIPEDHIIEGDF